MADQVRAVNYTPQINLRRDMDNAGKQSFSSKAKPEMIELLTIIPGSSHNPIPQNWCSRCLYQGMQFLTFTYMLKVSINSKKKIS